MNKYQIIRCVEKIYHRALKKNNEGLALQCLSTICKIEGFYAPTGVGRKLSVREHIAQLENALIEMRQREALTPLYEGDPISM